MGCGIFMGAERRWVCWSCGQRRVADKKGQEWWRSEGVLRE